MASDHGGVDFEALGRQYWTAWGEMLRSAQPGSTQPGGEGWQQSLDAWARMARGGHPEADATIDRFSRQAGEWFAQMQQVAARFSGQDPGAAEIAQAWRQALGAAGSNPFAGMLQAMRGQGLQGMDQWMEGAAPLLQAWQQQAAGLLGMPAFGFAREHQERWQRLAQAQLDYQQHNADYQALMAQAGQRAFELFERRLAERAASGRKLTSAREMFDLWIDAAEEAHADTAMSPQFRDTYGAWVNAQMRLRGALQREVEQAASTLGMPTRTEMDAAHRKITELERALRRIRDAMAQGAPDAARPAPARAAGDDLPTSRTAARAGAPSTTASTRPQPPPRKRASAQAETAGGGKPVSGQSRKGSGRAAAGRSTPTARIPIGKPKVTRPVSAPTAAPPLPRSPAKASKAAKAAKSAKATKAAKTRRSASGTSTATKVENKRGSMAPSSRVSVTGKGKR